MNAFTKLSDKGQIVVPKALRDIKGLVGRSGPRVVDAGDGVLLRPRRPKKQLSVSEAVEKLRAIYVHRGPPVSLDDMKIAVAEAASERNDAAR